MSAADSSQHPADRPRRRGAEAPMRAVRVLNPRERPSDRRGPPPLSRERRQVDGHRPCRSRQRAKPPRAAPPLERPEVSLVRTTRRARALVRPVAVCAGDKRLELGELRVHLALARSDDGRRRRDPRGAAHERENARKRRGRRRRNRRRKRRTPQRRASGGKSGSVTGPERRMDGGELPSRIDLCQSIGDRETPFFSGGTGVSRPRSMGAARLTSPIRWRLSDAFVLCRSQDRVPTFAAMRGRRDMKSSLIQNRRTCCHA